MGGNSTAVQLAHEIADELGGIVQLALIDTYDDPACSQKSALPTQEVSLVLRDLAEAIEFKENLPFRQSSIGKVFLSAQYNLPLRDQAPTNISGQHAMQQPPKVSFTRGLEARIGDIQDCNRLPASPPARNRRDVSLDERPRFGFNSSAHRKTPEIEIARMPEDRADGDHGRQRMKETRAIERNNPERSGMNPIDTHNIASRHLAHELSFSHSTDLDPTDSDRFQRPRSALT